MSRGKCARLLRRMPLWLATIAVVALAILVGVWLKDIQVGAVLGVAALWLTFNLFDTT